MIPKRVFWLVTGAAVGAGSSLWAERRVRRTVQQAVARLQPDALVSELGNSALHLAGAATERLRDSVTVGRIEMHQFEDQLWEELAGRGIAPGRLPMTPPPERPDRGSTPKAGCVPVVQEDRPEAPGPALMTEAVEIPALCDRRGGGHWIGIRRHKEATATNSHFHLGN